MAGYFNYNIRYVMNITDIDDKVILSFMNILTFLNGLTHNGKQRCERQNSVYNVLYTISIQS